MHVTRRAGPYAIGLSALAAALAGAADARADDGPFSALGNMLNASPTITLVSTGVVGLVDTTITGVYLVEATNGREADDSLLVTGAIVAVPQAIGFGFAPAFFDIDRWSPAENLGLLLPAQAWTAAIYTHGTWSLVSDKLPPGARLGVSGLIGLDYAFSATALGCLFRERWAPLEVGAAEIGVQGTELVFTIARAVEDAEHRPEWIALGGWSALLLAHGIGSVLVEAPGSRVSDAGASDSDAIEPPTVLPFAAPAPGGATAGVAGVF